MSKYSIKDIERLSGIRAHTLRIWEKRYGILAPQRTDTNIRKYSDEELRHILNIAVLNNSGYKISQIVRLTEAEMQAKVIEVSSKPASEEAQIEGLLLAMMELDEVHFEQIIANCASHLGFEETMLFVIYPFFQKVGLLWQAGTINPAQEHFISHLIRQKLIVAIDEQRRVLRPHPARVLFFLPEGEYHELGLLFFHFLARKEGHESVYLGQSVPILQAKLAADERECGVIATSTHAFASVNGRNKLLKIMLEHFPDKELVVCNRLKVHAAMINHEKLHINLSIDEFKSMLESNGIAR